MHNSDLTSGATYPKNFMIREYMYLFDSQWSQLSRLWAFHIKLVVLTLKSLTYLVLRESGFLAATCNGLIFPGIFTEWESKIISAAREVPLLNEFSVDLGSVA